MTIRLNLGMAGLLALLAPATTRADQAVDEALKGRDLSTIMKLLEADSGKEAPAVPEPQPPAPEAAPVESAAPAVTAPAPVPPSTLTPDERARIREQLRAEVERARPSAAAPPAAKPAPPALFTPPPFIPPTATPPPAPAPAPAPAAESDTPKRPGFFSRVFGGGKDGTSPALEETAAPVKPATLLPRPVSPSGDAMRRNRETLDSLFLASRQDVVRMAMGQASGATSAPVAPEVDPDDWQAAGPDAWRYNGEWENGTLHGQGKLAYADGWSYVGSWKNGAMDGQGALTLPDGTVYEGTWRGGRMHGLGKLTYPDGWSFIGNWKDGQISGQGTLVHPGR